MKFNRLAQAFFLMGFILFSFSCQKGAGGDGTRKLSVFLTDGPADYAAVNIDIVSVEAKIDTSREHEGDDHFGDRDSDLDDRDHQHDDFGSWTSLNAKSGVFNVLALRNGIDTLLASGDVKGTIRKIRITLGSNNTVVTNDGVSHPLILSNETSNYLYIHIREEHHHDSVNTAGLWGDFDIARSIFESDGKFYLRPRLRPFCDENFPGLEGKVTPWEARAVIRVYNATDTANAIPNPDGRFRVRGLNPGTYSVLYDAFNGYQDTTVKNVTIASGSRYKLPDVVLHK
mgnify:CR=1 FL=1